MSVYLSDSLELQLGADATAFANAFELFKENWPQHEYTEELFGKDGSYVLPSVGGMKYTLRHVHLKPEFADDSRGWMASFRRFGRKTSDRVLVYAQAGTDDFLLIDVLENAHEVAKMQSTVDTALMNRFAEIARAFIEDGDIIA